MVRREGIDVHLAPKAFDLLLILVTNQRNAVPHEQLHTALWPGVHVSETSLAALVTQLRKALGDTSGDGRVIRTLHRVGYAFIGDAIVAGHTPVAEAPVYQEQSRPCVRPASLDCSHGQRSGQVRPSSDGARRGRGGDFRRLPSGRPSGQRAGQSGVSLTWSRCD